MGQTVAFSQQNCARQASHGPSIIEPRFGYLRGAEVSTVEEVPAGHVRVGPGSRYPVEVTRDQLFETLYRVQDSRFPSTGRFEYTWTDDVPLLDVYLTWYYFYYNGDFGGEQYATTNEFNEIANREIDFRVEGSSTSCEGTNPYAQRAEAACNIVVPAGKTYVVDYELEATVEQQNEFYDNAELFLDGISEQFLGSETNYLRCYPLTKQAAGQWVLTAGTHEILLIYDTVDDEFHTAEMGVNFKITKISIPSSATDLVEAITPPETPVDDTDPYVLDDDKAGTTYGAEENRRAFWASNAEVPPSIVSLFGESYDAGGAGYRDLDSTLELGMWAIQDWDRTGFNHEGRFTPSAGQAAPDPYGHVFYAKLRTPPPYLDYEALSPTTYLNTVFGAAYIPGPSGVDHPFAPDARLFLGLDFEVAVLSSGSGKEVRLSTYKDGLLETATNPAYVDAAGINLNVRLSAEQQVSIPLYCTEIGGTYLDVGTNNSDFLLEPIKWWTYAKPDDSPYWGSDNGLRIP